MIISPCRNEEKLITRTIESMISQTRLPDLWIIVDDGSTDSTAEIVEKYAAEHDWIKLVRNERTGERKLGGAVVRAFYYGFEQLDGFEFDIVAKLDCDLELPPDCIEAHLKLFEDPKVGIAGGAVHLVVGDKLEFERYPDYFVSGATKFYRRKCFEDINGLLPTLGWDYIDVIDARRHGWKTLSDHNIVVKHFRLMGSAHGSLKSRFRWGHASYIIGSHPLFAFLKGVYRMLDRPWIIGGFAIILGYFSCYLNPRIKRIKDKDLIRYVRKEQMYRLFHGNRLPESEGV